MTVTLRLLDDDKRMPEVNREDVIVRQHKDRVQVTGWTAARGDHAGLDRFILIDDASNTSLGSQLDDLRIYQRPAANHFSGRGTCGMDGANQPELHNRTQSSRESSAASHRFQRRLWESLSFGHRPHEALARRLESPRGGNGHGWNRPGQRGSRYRGLGFISPDVDSASSVEQRTGTIIHTIFIRAVGRLGSNFWEIANGQNGIAKLSDGTGGESFYLGTQNPVGFKPYLDNVQKALDNQYLLEFRAVPGKKSGLQYVKLTTEVAGAELVSADSVWVKAK